MVRLTLIARQRDGLPLAEGLDNDKDPDLVSYKQQAKVRRAHMHLWGQTNAAYRGFGKHLGHEACSVHFTDVNCASRRLARADAFQEALGTTQLGAGTRFSRGRSTHLPRTQSRRRMLPDIGGAQLPKEARLSIPGGVKQRVHAPLRRSGDRERQQAVRIHQVWCAPSMRESDSDMLKTQCGTLR